MQRLLEEFAKLFDLDHRVHGTRLGDLVERAIDRLEEQAPPDWGSPGPAKVYESESRGSLDFFYTPHLFPEMPLTLRLAHKLQFHMLPREVPSAAPVSIASVLESYCHLSGDVFGWEMLSDDSFLIWIVDVSGHGVRAGLASAVLKVLVDNLRQRGRVDSLARGLNDTFVACLQDDRSNLFATGVFMVLSGDGSVCYTSAGHPPVLVRRVDGQIEELSSNCLPIGMFPDRPYTATETRLEPGDTMLLYSDGVLESTNAKGEPFGLDRLRKVLSSETGTPRSLARSLYRTIADFQDMDELDDDVTFVATRMH